MRKLLMAAVALTAVTATPALASTSQTYNFTGSVAAICTIAGAASTVDFGALTDGSGAYTQNGVAKDATDTDAYCNQAQTTASIKHTDLFTTNSASTGFTNVVPMSASLTTFVGASPAVVLADSTPASGSTESSGSSGTVGAFTGLKVTATLGSIGSDKLVAGTYNGTITVDLTPAP
jgi:hypothetical protein